MASATSPASTAIAPLGLAPAQRTALKDSPLPTAATVDVLLLERAMAIRACATLSVVMATAQTPLVENAERHGRTIRQASAP